MTAATTSSSSTAEKAVLTGKKLDQKYLLSSHRLYRPPQGSPAIDTLMATKPELAMELAVKGMLPKNTIGRRCRSQDCKRLRRRRASSTQAQKPDALAELITKEVMTNMYEYKHLISTAPAEERAPLLAYALYQGTGVRLPSTAATIDDYFGLETLKLIVRQPLGRHRHRGASSTSSARVAGGGVTGQAGAIRHGHFPRAAPVLIPRTSVPTLKKAGFLTRDPRMKERKKYGLKAARRAPQFSKR